MKRCIARLVVSFLFLFSVFSQENQAEDAFDFSGYISGMPSLYWLGKTTPPGEESPLWQLLVHNRLNFEWYPHERFTASVQLRNQLIGGDFVRLGDYSSGVETENYFLPLTYYQTLGDKFILTIAVDRLWFQYTLDKLEVKIGRQRVNWGQTFVWNPNDLFNSYNYFDFDYPERPGADALRMQYFTSSTSSIDLAAKIDSSGNITGGGLFRFNHWNTDFQILAGYFSQSNQTYVWDPMPGISVYEDNDLVGGVGLSGAIGNVSIRGESSYFYSLKENSDSTNLFLLSLGSDYSFPDQTMLMFEFMYNSNVVLPAGSTFYGFYSGSQSVKTLTYTKYNFFGQVAYAVSPIINTTLGGMYFFDSNLMGYYIGPGVDLSLGDDLLLSGIFQFFSFKSENPLTGAKEWANNYFAFLRIKWNF
jgi:hypothetical protein